MNRLGWVDRTYILELAAELGIPARATDLNHYDLLTGDEAFHTGNTICILPVRSIDGAPGPVTH